MKAERFLFVVLIASYPGIGSGCSKKEDKAKPATDTPDAREAASHVDADAQSSVLLNDVLSLWESQQQDEAVKQFLGIRWHDPAVLEGAGVLNISERTFVLLPHNEREHIQQLANTFGITLRDLARHVLAEGETLAGSGDTAMAKKHFEAVRACGEALSKPNQLALIQAIGKAIVKAADSKLDDMK